MCSEIRTKADTGPAPLLAPGRQGEFLSSPQSPAGSQGETHLHLLRIGACRAPAALTATGAGWHLASFPAGAALMQHPRHGAILFDGGYGNAFFDATRSLPERIYRWLTPVQLPAQQRLPAQLAALGVTTPDLVILSHLHADHVAGLFDLNPLPHRILASAAAIDGLQLGRIKSLRAGCPLGLRDGLRALPLARIEDCPAVSLAPFGLDSFGCGYNLLADGSVIAVSLPGHGIGQMGFYLPKVAEGPVFLIADAAWSLAALALNTPPPNSTLRRLGAAPAYLQTFAALRALQQTQPGLRILPSHCPESFAAAAVTG